MKYLITGSVGLLGGNMSYLLSQRHEVLGLDILKTNIPNVICEIIDLKHHKSVKDVIYRYKPDVIVHCAAITNVDFCEKNPKEAYLMNRDVTNNIAEICAKLKIKMIYISTDAVFDGKRSDLYREYDKVNPINVYGMSKLDGEEKVLKYKNNIVIRTNIYGYNMKEQFSFGEWILNCMLNSETIGMFYDVKFSPILVNDLTYIIEELIKQNKEGIFHVCSTGSISKYDFGLELKKIFELKTGVIKRSSIYDSNLIALRSENMGMDNTKICNTLELKIRDPLSSILEFKNLYDREYNKLMKSFM